MVVGFEGELEGWLEVNSVSASLLSRGRQKES